MAIYDDVNDMAEYFTNIFVDTCKQFIPFKVLEINPRDKPWMNKFVKAKLKERDKWHRRLKSVQNERNKSTYANKSLEANLAMMQAKGNYFEIIKQKLCNPNIDSKQYWHLLKSLYGSKVDSGIPAIIDGDDIISSSKAKADLFNKHFLEKSTLPNDLPDLPILQMSIHHLHTIVTTEHEVTKILLSLNVNKASGFDNIGNRLLKKTSLGIAQPLTYLCNESLSRGTFPNIWKKANVPPVFKQNDKQSKNNYRPISLLPNIGKVLERVVFIHLYHFCIIHNLLTWRNSGYKPLDSSINQLIFISHKIYESLEKGEDVCYVSLDASAAFDRVWHSGLLYKLRSKGITGNLYDWFHSYLSDRYQRVVIKGQYSEWIKIQAGVPQGSILGPLLFLIYIDDIIDDIESEIFLFADDTSLLEKITNPALSFNKINRDLTKLHNWSKQWLVNFNPTKTKYIVFSKKLHSPDYPPLQIGGEQLQRVRTHKQLGVIFNESMTWEDHVNENCKKAMNRLVMLKKLGAKIPRKSRFTIYLSYIRPVLEFGFQLYDNSTNEILEKIERTQREALLFVTVAYKKTSHRELLKEVGLPSLETRRKSHKIQFIYKAKNDLLPQYLIEIIPSTVGSLNEYNLQNANDIIVPKSRKNYFLKSYIPSSIRAWNESSLDIKRATSLNSLKAKLADLYGSTTYYLFLSEDGNGAVNHSRMRMGLSALNAHRKRYNFIPSSSCDFCNYRIENVRHFLLYCPAFAAQRQVMMDEIMGMGLESVQALLNYLNTPRLASDLVRVLLRGSGEEQCDEILFKTVQMFISSTNRFR